ncbi:TipJ family phage tail tip protein [Moraxella catarrhalis]|uniref:TipJ family phage tail tip protein n=2 Tax=Moraxella catarrhalis TaxID=480 RepID=UPI001D0DBF3E|nr:phage tail protein [Moraxella catarrhalis]
MNIYGAKRQKQSSNKPYIQKDTASSTNSYQALYGLSEGEIYGLVDGGKSIRLDGTPIINDNGEPNFPDVSWDFRAGSIDQTHIKGFSSVENEQSVNVELRHDRPYTKAINNKQLSAVAIRLGFNSLREQKGNGDVVGYRIEYAIDVQTDGGAWEMVLNTAVDDKVSQGYQRSHRIDLPKAQQGWSVRVRRLTPNRDSEMVSDTMVVSAVTEIIDAKLRYPCTALLALKYDAQTFSNIAKVAVHVRGMLIQVPTNYDPTARTYDGLWDGTFKLAYTNNPAWVFYDICTAKRYGLGDRLAGKVDKWSLYRLAQYCDEMVDDGKGGKEPRFTVNVYLQKADDAYRVLQNLASVFRALSFWDGTSIVVDADTPKEPVYVFSNANVIGGEFSYTGTRARDRHTIVKCAYDDPDNNFETDYIYVQDEHAIAKYGINQLELNLFGCTSKGQAQRAGIWALKSEQLETETVSFSTGLDGFIPKVGEIIHVQDNHRAGRMQAGRIVATDGRQITLDRMAGKVGDTLMVGDNSAQIVQIDDTVITTDTAIGRAGQVFAISSSDVAPRAYRVMTISQNDDASFSFTALQYEIGKFTATNNIAAIPKKEVSVIKAHVLTPPNSVGITERTRTHQGQAITTLVISWEQVVGAVAYIVEYKKDSNAWQTHKVSSHSLEIDGVYAGAYQAKVRAIDAFDNESLATSSQLTQITGKQGKPPRPINLSVQGILFGMNLGWNFARGSDDTNYTEIQVSPDGRSNIATLGTFAYPTNKHEITGLQGNLTQFYRARIVDKLGNTSDWTDWVSGTTSADADKVLDILSGQISQSHLDQSLRTPIGKIGTIESNISKINVDLPELNQSIADAQSTLNTAVASIDIEKKRLSSAIVDINTLKQSNNAKTQEIANLTQTVSGHTSQVRELGVTTGDLSQKYSQVKTQANNATSEITAIKQTQGGQATSVERIRSEMANKASTASVNSLTESLANKEQALSRRIRTVESTASGNTSSINTLNQSLTDKERALTRKQEQLTAQLANKASVASINTLNQSLTTKERALTEQINRAKSEMGGRITQISNETRTLTDANRTIGERINQLNSELAGADSISDNLLINSNRTLVTGAYLIATYRISETLANGDKVRLTVIADIGINRTGFMAYNSNSAGGSKLADISESRGNVYTAEFEWNVGTGGNNELRLYHNASNTRSISTITSVSLQKITTGSGLASIKSSVANLERTLTTNNQSLSERINTLQTTLNGQTASIQQHAQTLNGLSAQWTLKVQSGGIVSGIGLASNNGVSDFAVIADKFYVASPQGDKKPMFSVITRPTSINGTTVPAVVSLNGDLIGSGTISGDKIRANTQITAPNIRGGSISIGSNFSVDSQGNLNANSGVFRGQVFADKITGQIDVESLKSSAVALGYDIFISPDGWYNNSPTQFDKAFKASYPSLGSIINGIGDQNYDVGSILYEIRVFCKRAITVKQKLYVVDDNLYCYINGRSAFGYYEDDYGYDVPRSYAGRRNEEISLSLQQGLNTIQYINNNSGKHSVHLVLIGDFIDNNIIKFA